VEVSTTKRIAKNAFWLFWGSAISKLIEFVTIVYLARVLTASGFGLFSIAQAILVYLLLMVDSGTSVLGIREIAKDKEKAPMIGSNIFPLRLVLSLIVFLLVLFLLIFLRISLELRLLFAFTFLSLFPRAINPEWLFQGLERNEYAGISKILQQLFFFGLVVLMVKSVNDLLAVPWSQFLGGLFASLILLFVLLKYFAPFRLKDIRPGNWWAYFIIAVPLGISSVFMQVYYNLDMIMLGFMQRPEVVGWYNAAYKLFYVFLGSMGVITITVFPMVCRLFKEGKEKARHFLEKYLHLMFLGAVPAALWSFYCSDPAIRLIYGNSYLPGSLAFKILVLTILIIAVSGIYGTLVLLPTGKNKEFMYSVGIGALSNIVLNFILIPPFSLVGAAVATLITEIIVAVAFFYWARREARLDVMKFVAKPALAGGTAFLVTFLTLNFFRLGDLLFLFSSFFIFSTIYLVIIGLSNEGGFLRGFVREIIRG